MFCDLLKILLRIEFRTKGDTGYQGLRMRPCFENSIIPGFTPSFWGHERRKQGNKTLLWWKSWFFRSDCISTIYPKSRFCTKRHKRRCFQGFSGFFESFSRNAEKENCKFEHRKCSFVFDLCFSRINPRPWQTPFLWLQRSAFCGVKTKEWIGIWPHPIFSPHKLSSLPSAEGRVQPSTAHPSGSSSLIRLPPCVHCSNGEMLPYHSSSSIIGMFFNSFP